LLDSGANKIASGQKDKSFGKPPDRMGFLSDPADQNQPSKFEWEKQNMRAPFLGGPPQGPSSKKRGETQAKTGGKREEEKTCEIKKMGRVDPSRGRKKKAKLQKGKEREARA